MRSLHVYHLGGQPYRVVADDPALADVAIYFVADDQPDRLMLVAIAVASERDRMRRERQACEINTQRHGVGIACEAAVERCQSVVQQINAVISELLELSRVAHGDPQELAAGLSQPPRSSMPASFGIYSGN